MWAHFLARDIAQKVLFGYLLEHFNLPHLNYIYYIIMLNSAQRPNLTGYPFIYVSICRKFTILISHNQLPSGLVAQLVHLEQRWASLEVVGLNPTAGSESFFLFLHVGPFPC